jgi:glycine oxidase
MSDKRQRETATDVLIIGGGVIGCAIAYALRQHDITVTLLEKGEIGAQASGAAAGLLAPLGPLSGPGPLADLVLAGFATFPVLVSELEQATGLRLGYEQTGALRVIRNQKRVAHLRKRWESWQPLGLRMQWLTGEEACRHEPLLADDVAAAVFAPEEAQIDARQMTQAFAQAARNLGASLLPHHEVISFVTQKRRVIGARTNQGQTFGCGQVIVASGAWAEECCSWLATPMPVTPLHGQLLALPQPAPSLRSLVFGEGIYLVPRGSSLLVGATKEERGFDLQADAKGTAWLLETARRLVPQLARLQPTAVWTGLRPKTPDTRPIFGFLPFWENVAIAAGHNSIGIILSGITGQCMAELLLTGQLPLLAQPFSADRFSMTQERSGESVGDRQVSSQQSD